MRIGVMLRHFDQHEGGVRVYTRQLLHALLGLNAGHEYFFFYRNPALVGTYAGHRDVTEVALPGRTVLGWDQWSVPKAMRRYGIDVLYNPKYSIPLTGDCPSAWVCHGLDWYVMPWASRRIDRLSHRFLIPRYANKANAIVAVSEVTRQHMIEYLHVSPERVHTIYAGVDEAFKAVADENARSTMQYRYRLPQHFLLYSGAIYPPKNFTRLVQAYARVGPQLGIPLVIAGGENRFLSEHELKVPEKLGLGNWVQWLGWVSAAMLPCLYQMADALLLPSLFESYGLPIVEAMAAGVPVLTSDRYGSKEIAGTAALLVNPESVDSIAEGMQRIASEPVLRAQLIAAGRERVRNFSWKQCAERTLALLEGIAGERRVAHRQPPYIRST